MREKYFTAFIFWIIINTNLSCVQIFGLHFFKLTKHRVVPTFFIDDHVLNLLTQVPSYKMLQVYYLSTSYVSFHSLWKHIRQYSIFLYSLSPFVLHRSSVLPSFPSIPQSYP